MLLNKNKLINNLKKTLLFKKKGDMEIEEIIKIIIVLLVFVIAIGGIILLFGEGGGRMINSIKDIFRFGK